MSFAAAAAGAAFVARPLQAAKLTAKIAKNVCTTAGAVTLVGIGFGFAPHVQARAPLDSERRRALLEDFQALVDRPPAALRADGTEEEAVGMGLPQPCFEDLRRPWLFGVFTEAARTVFALYADATGVMTPTEFRCALHKMIDLALTWYGRQGGSPSPEAQAAATRRLLERVADGAFRVIDEDGNGRIDAAEFSGAVLLVLAVANGKAAADAPILRRLAFRVVDEDGDGLVSEQELLRWVKLALEHGTAPPGAQLEPRGPWGIFGTRTLTPATLTRKWLRAADSDGDRALSQDDFALLAPSLRVHEVIASLARRFAV